MKTVNTEVLSFSDTSVLLRLRLGPLRPWHELLADNMKGCGDFGGIHLKPIARQYDGRGFRPVYAVDDVMKFIDVVLSSVSSACKTPIKPSILPLTRGKHWRKALFDKDGLPVARASANDHKFGMTH